MITSHPGSRHRDREREREHHHRENQNQETSSAITITDLSGGFSPSELWRRSASKDKDKDKDKDKNNFENHAFSPPTSSQQTGVRQPGTTIISSHFPCLIISTHLYSPLSPPPSSH